MKLISLNIWGGQILEPLLKFISEKKDVDVFCFQEVLNETKDFPKGNTIGNADSPSHDIYSKLQNILVGHNGYFAPRQDDEGLAIFIKKDIEVKTANDIFVYGFKNSWVDGNPETKGVNLQYVRLKVKDEVFTIAHIHGFYSRLGKTDTPERIQQSQNINSFFAKLEGEKILSGDFNLEYNTESVSILEKNLTNLIKKYNITSTRTSLYEDYKIDKFADYMFVSKDVTILDFKILPDAVSDHAALYLEFGI